jgi:hypothetical protein
VIAIAWTSRIAVAITRAGILAGALARVIVGHVRLSLPPPLGIRDVGRCLGVEVAITITRRVRAWRRVVAHRWAIVLGVKDAAGDACD